MRIAKPGAAMVAITTVCVVVVEGFHSGVSAQGASACDDQDTNDEMYCRFFVDNIGGDLAHVERVTQVTGHFWYEDKTEAVDTEVYAFYWCYEADGNSIGRGIALRFTAGEHRVIEVLGTLGFEPEVNYWQCNETNGS